MDVGVDARDSSFVWSIKIIDGIPDLSLDFDIVFELINDLVVGSDFDFIVVLVEFRMDILG